MYVWHYSVLILMTYSIEELITYSGAWCWQLESVPQIAKNIKVKKVPAIGLCRFRGRGSYSFQLPRYRTCIPSTDPQKQHKKWFSDSVRTLSIIAQGRIIGYVGSRNQDYWEPVPIGQIDTQLYHSSSRQWRDLSLILFFSLIPGWLCNFQPFDLPLDGYYLIFLIFLVA